MHPVDVAGTIRRRSSPYSRTKDGRLLDALSALAAVPASNRVHEIGSYGPAPVRCAHLTHPVEARASPPNTKSVTFPQLTGNDNYNQFVLFLTCA